MSINNVEMQDSVGNIYYPHTDASIVKFGETTVGASLSENTQDINNLKTTTSIDFPFNSSWVSGVGEYLSKVLKNGKVVTVFLNAISQNTYTSILGTLPVGYRPKALVECFGTSIKINTSGLMFYDNATQKTTLNAYFSYVVE